MYEHDGVRDLVRVPRINDFGLDRDYDGGLCAEVKAPAGIYSERGTLRAYFIDVQDSTWMRVWSAP